MRRAIAAALLAGASACVGFNIRAPDDCAAICETAVACGFLPSALGWSEDGVVGEAQENCERRCASSPADDPVVAALVGCFTGESDVAAAPRWCTSQLPDDQAYAELWSACADVSTCLRRTLRDDELRGDVALTVQMMPWSDYELHLGLAPAAFPGSASGDPNAIESCRPALCSDEVCSSLECSIDDDCFDSEGAEAEDTDALEEACSEVCELPDGENCDTRLCRVGHLTISTVCQQLAAQKITLKVYERDRLPAVEVFQDVEAGINPDCETSTFLFDPAMVELAPGPIKVIAAVEGRLTGAELAEIGYFAAGEAFEPETSTAYCVEFVGPAMTVRAGKNEVAVPLGERAALAAQKDVLWRRCG